MSNSGVAAHCLHPMDNNFPLLKNKQCDRLTERRKKANELQVTAGEVRKSSAVIPKRDQKKVTNRRPKRQPVE
jgi:hypothetical protein